MVTRLGSLPLQEGLQRSTVSHRGCPIHPLDSSTKSSRHGAGAQWARGVCPQEETYRPTQQTRLQNMQVFILFESLWTITYHWLTHLGRIRKVKCNEEKPECARCSSTGRRCEWFPDPLAAFESASPASEQDAAGVRQVAELYSNKKVLLPLPTSPYLDPDQHRSFQYFRQRTAPQLSGVFSGQFWEYVLLQAVSRSFL